jgi:hypothetical protein
MKEGKNNCPSLSADKQIIVNSAAKIKCKAMIMFCKVTNLLLPSHFPIDFISFLNLKSMHFLNFNQIARLKKLANKLPKKQKNKECSMGISHIFEKTKSENISAIKETKRILRQKIKFFSLFKNKNICDFLLINSYKIGKNTNCRGNTNKSHRKAQK